MSKSTQNGSEVIGYIADFMAIQFEKYGIPRHKAEMASIALAEALQLSFGGQLVYFHNGKKLKNDRIALETLADFNDGLTAVKLATKYSVSVPAIYGRLARARVLQQNRDKPC